MQAINQQYIKYNNLKRIYTLVDRQAANSRAQIANVTKLSKTTVSSLVEELIAEGYIVETGTDVSAGLGRKPNLLELDNSRNFVAVVAWHRQRLVAALMNSSAQTVVSVEQDMAEEEDYVAQSVALLERELFPAAAKGRILGVCIVVPSMVDDKNEQIISTVLQLGEKDNVVHRLRKALLGYPLAILNDTACYAYAEYCTSDIQEDEFVFVNIGKGVGAVLLSKGIMMRGANGMTTQFGHFSIDRNGPRCDCGSRGCMERMVGERVLPELVESFSLQGALPAGRKIQFRDVGALVAQKNLAALALVEHLAEDLAYGLSNLVSLIHPQLIVIGGFGMNLGEYYLHCIQKKLEGMGFSQFMKSVHVRFACVDELAELQGAARYYLDQHFTFDGSMANRLILY